MQPLLSCWRRLVGLSLMLSAPILLGCQRGAPPQVQSPTSALLSGDQATGEPGAKRLRELLRSNDQKLRSQAFGQLLEMAGEKSSDFASKKAARAALATLSAAELRQCQKECLETPPRLNRSALTPTDFEWWSLLFEIQPAMVDQALPLLLERNDRPEALARSVTQVAYAVPGKQFEHWLKTVPHAPWKDDARRVAAFEGILLSVSTHPVPKDAAWVKNDAAPAKYQALKQRIQGADAAHWSAWAALWLKAPLAKGGGMKRLPDGMLQTMTNSGLSDALSVADLEDAFFSSSPDVVALAMQLQEKKPRWKEFNVERLVKCLEARAWKPRPTLENPWHAGLSWRAVMALSQTPLEQLEPLLRREEVVASFVELSNAEDEASALLGLQVLDGLKLLERNRIREEILLKHWHNPHCRAAVLLRVEGQARDDLKSLYEKFDAARPRSSGPAAVEALEMLGRSFATAFTLGAADLVGLGVLGGKSKPMPWNQAALPAWRDAAEKFKDHPNRHVAAVARQMQTVGVQAR
ncbi:MAG: hypothetical protein JNM56_13690 [Planctomycetia bacterium]|nr:hypothetical protein [Planctomycetia bacterium]